MPPKKKTIEETFIKSDSEKHPLLKPGMYIGDTKCHSEEMWVFDNDSEKMKYSIINFSPGFLKIFDEILTNALDHSARDSTVTKIKVNLNKEDNSISIWNNGAGIPIVKHKEYDMYVPELVLGNMFSSSNYDENQKRTWSGTNGVGGTICNIFSKKFIVETVDSDQKLKYIQEFSDNMTIKGKPKITKCSTTSYTRITFIPDYKRFEMKGLDNDTLSLLYKRVYDAIACTDKKVSLSLNDKVIKGKGLVDYTKYFFEEGKTFYEMGESNGMVWEYSVLPWDSFSQVSFVNVNSTIQGGNHVNYILNQIVSKLKTLIETKKKIKDIKPAIIKDRLFLFVRATIVNPEFNSQTKEKLTTQIKDFGCKIEVSDAFIAKLYKSQIVEEIVELQEKKVQSELKKKTDGSKKTRVIIPNLDDATYAGTSKSSKCTLILTEGLSAKTFALWGRDNADYYGVFSLKGKGLNVRSATAKQLLENEEINALKQILGLKQGVKYKSISELRYGKILLLVDADSDGHHIKGLVVNIFHFWWPELLKLDFFQTLRTPILKVTKGKKVVEFFTEQDYDIWCKTNSGGSTQYFKGLGTSQKKDAKDIFKRFDELKIDYIWKNKECDSSILLAFDKDKGKGKVAIKMSDKRKEWLDNYDKNAYVDTLQKQVPFTDLINKELIHFSMYDNVRSIPSICDGLKPSQRKILYYMLKNNIVKNIKVAQLSGYVSAETGYHHGEVSLQGAIIGLAQDFISKNNINLLLPEGNHGSRYIGGKDSASPRYIFTKLAPITQKIFNKEDFDILDYKIDDGMSVEPEYYLPIIPMVLINGCEGIGTGYSTTIPNYNPKDIIDVLLAKLTGKVPTTPLPYYKGFKGKVNDLGNGNYSTSGIWEEIGETKLKITEIPVNTWVTPYKEFLEGFLDVKEGTGLCLKNLTNNTTDENSSLEFILEFKSRKDLVKLNIAKDLKLTHSFSTNNMHLFDVNCNTPKKFNNVMDIIDYYYTLRLELYEKRRIYQIGILEEEIKILDAKIRFIEEYISGILLINKQKRDAVERQLTERKYPKVSDGFGYLVNMPIISMTFEKISDLKGIIQTKRNKLEFLQKTTASKMWIKELNELKIEL